MDEASSGSLRPTVAWKRIEEFVGFGRRDAPVVFIGIEEGLKDASALDEDLAIRSTYESPVMDLKEAHRGIAGTDRYFDPDRAPRQPTWRVMADVMLRRDGNASPTGADRRRYRALRLGRDDGDSLLAELLPYPHPKSSDWLYKRFEKFETRADYEKAMLPERKRLLRTVLDEAKRAIVVCYGKTHWAHYQDLFDGMTWTDVGPHRVGQGECTRVVLTTHFSGYDFNTDAQLAELARVALNRGATMTVYDDQPLHGYRIEIGVPDDFAGDLPAIFALLDRRGHVPPHFLRQNLPHARVIAIGRHGNDIVSVCALKGASPRHNRTIERHSGYALGGAPELGYAATYEHHTGRGLATRLHQEILNRAGDMVYATVRIPNLTEEHILSSCGFRDKGTPWKGEGDYQIRLWVRPRNGETQGR